MDTINRAITWVKRHVFLRSEHVAESAGAADKGRPILTDSNGQIDATLLAAATLLAKLLTVDGAGSGLDADTLDSLQATAFALLAGRSGGQTLYGGTDTGDDLYLRPTSHATKGDVIMDQGKVGVGTTAPEVILEVVVEATTACVLATQYNDAATPGGGFVGRHARGSAAAPSAVQANDALFFLGGRGYGATGWGATSRVAMYGRASQAWTDTNQGTYVSFETTPDNSTTRAERMRIAQDGNVGLNATSPTISDGVGLHIGGKVLRLDTAKSPASNGTGNAGEICWDSSYLYVCTAANTWKRVALTGGY